MEILSHIYYVLTKILERTFDFLIDDEPLVSKEVREMMANPVDRIAFKSSLRELQNPNCNEVEILLESGKTLKLTKGY